MPLEYKVSTLCDVSLSSDHKVPWIEGPPDKVIDFDDDQEMTDNGITLTDGLRRGDYYAHYKSCKWMVVERKDRSGRIDHGITQIKSTVHQLKDKGFPVDGVILVVEKINPREASIYGVGSDNELFSKLSTARKKIPIDGMNLKFYTTIQVDQMIQVYHESR